MPTERAPSSSSSVAPTSFLGPMFNMNLGDTNYNPGAGCFGFAGFGDDDDGCMPVSNNDCGTDACFSGGITGDTPCSFGFGDTSYGNNESYDDGDCGDFNYNPTGCLFGDSIGSCYKPVGDTQFCFPDDSNDAWDTNPENDIYGGNIGCVGVSDIGGIGCDTFDGYSGNDLVGNGGNDLDVEAQGVPDPSFVCEGNNRVASPSLSYPLPQSVSVSASKSQGKQNKGKLSNTSRQNTTPYVKQENKSASLLVTESSKLITLSLPSKSDHIDDAYLESLPNEDYEKEEGKAEEKTEEILEVIMKKKDPKKVSQEKSKSEEYPDFDLEAATSSSGSFTMAVLSDNKLVSLLAFENGYSLRDLCGFDNAFFALLSNGDILKLIPNNPTSLPAEMNFNISSIKNNVRLNRVFNFGGYLYGITDNRLHLLDARTYSNISWKWNTVSWAPDLIVDASTTLTGDALFILSRSNKRDTGHLYVLSNTNSHSPKLAEKIPMNGKTRVYGIDKNNYLELSALKRTAIKFPDGEKVPNIALGALTHDNDVIRIPPNLVSRIRAIRMVNWEPYYIVKS